MEHNHIHTQYRQGAWSKPSSNITRVKRKISVCAQTDRQLTNTLTQTIQYKGKQYVARVPLLFTTRKPLKIIDF